MAFTRCAAGEACASGLKARSQVFDWALSPAEITELTALKSPSGTPTIFQLPPYSNACPGPDPDLALALALALTLTRTRPLTLTRQPHHLLVPWLPRLLLRLQVSRR